METRHRADLLSFLILFKPQADISRRPCLMGSFIEQENDERFLPFSRLSMGDAELAALREVSQLAGSPPTEKSGAGRSVLRINRQPSRHRRQSGDRRHAVTLMKRYHAGDGDQPLRTWVSTLNMIHCSARRQMIDVDPENPMITPGG